MHAVLHSEHLRAHSVRKAGQDLRLFFVAQSTNPHSLRPFEAVMSCHDSIVSSMLQGRQDGYGDSKEFFFGEVIIEATMSRPHRIGKAIKAARAMDPRRPSQETLAKELGISRSAVAQYEAGNTAPSPEVLEKIAAAFGRTIDWFHSYNEFNLTDDHETTPESGAAYFDAMRPASRPIAPGLRLTTEGRIPDDLLDAFVSFLDQASDPSRALEIPGWVDIPTYLADIVDFVVVVAEDVSSMHLEEGQVLGFKFIEEGERVQGGVGVLVGDTNSSLLSKDIWRLSLGYLIPRPMSELTLVFHTGAGLSQFISNKLTNESRVLAKVTVRFPFGLQKRPVTVTFDPDGIPI